MSLEPAAELDAPRQPRRSARSRTLQELRDDAEAQLAAAAKEDLTPDRSPSAAHAARRGARQARGTGRRADAPRQGRRGHRRTGTGTGNLGRTRLSDLQAQAAALAEARATASTDTRGVPPSPARLCRTRSARPFAKPSTPGKHSVKTEQHPSGCGNSRKRSPLSHAAAERQRRSCSPLRSGSPKSAATTLRTRPG